MTICAYINQDINSQWLSTCMIADIQNDIFLYFVTPMKNADSVSSNKSHHVQLLIDLRVEHVAAKVKKNNKKKHQ